MVTSSAESRLEEETETRQKFKFKIYPPINYKISYSIIFTSGAPRVTSTSASYANIPICSHVINAAHVPSEIRQRNKVLVQKSGWTFADTAADYLKFYHKKTITIKSQLRIKKYII